MSIEQTLSEVSYRHELLHDVKDMALVFERANLAVTAVGGTAWEMAAVGLPAVLIPIARNQETGAEYLDREGAAINLKSQHALQYGELASTVKKLMQSPELLAAMSCAGPRVCDGKGPERVCAILTALSGKPVVRELVLRRALAEDMEHIFRLVNDPVVRSYSFLPEPIRLEDHAAWYANRLASQGTIFYVLDIEGVIVALVRYDRNGDEAEIDVAVHSAFRGRGFCSRVLIETAEAAIESLSVTRLKAVVFEENTASRRCFMKAGFSETGQILVKGKGCVTYGLDMHSRGIH
jgi:RimJ/RimL family protein N-acetyltransferase